MSVTSTPKTHTAGSQTLGSDSARGGRRRRTKLTSEKKIADDEFMAAAIGDVEWLKQSLRDAGPDVNFDKNGLTAIHLAAIHGRLECLKVCIEKFKIDINLPSSTGWRPVHLCISNQTGNRSLQCLAYLLEKGADGSISNDDGITPVHQAASEGHVQCLKLLLEIGAKIDGKDCRDNTPLDLAKLWGHRKCARILAAEMWHQDKDSVAKEMQQLKKIKMQQVLRELEEDEEMKAAQQFYGDEAFKQWMASKNLKSKSAGAEGSDKAGSLGGYKPNSVARNARQDASKKTTVKVSLDARKMTDRTSKQGKVDDEPLGLTDEELLKGLDGGIENDEDRDKNKEKRKKVPTFYNDTEWNKSTKAPKKGYVPNLMDDFPRDEYTMMARVKGAPKFYEGKFHRPITPNNVDEDIRMKGPNAKLRQPKLPREVIEHELSINQGLIDRGMLFKCKHIGDVHTKKKYDIDTKGRSEAPLHLLNDVRSFMMKNSVRLLDVPPKSTGSSKTGSDSSKSRFARSELTDDHFPLPMVMQTLKNMSRPTHFPNIYGREYEINLGDIK
ncbi:ankyrin repeat domain-containing protein 53 [Plakobranchus ocellatus]|uniref:Ankyrin repeat domain-containing protein 53 n=1 Tax=Plakobranchus ocellatus TaxID=259542 RepID=A0AAV4C661_9GAST|nr:ankyrin repeat domain-containing protein 53 [Plakobranchus ocellatus]